MKLVDAFIGTTQSKYAAIAIVVAMLFASLTVIFSKDKVPAGQKFSIVLLLLLVTIPSVLYTLFQMTCLVTGVGADGETWWCGIYAWFLVVITVIYAVVVVIMAILSVVAETNIKKTESFYSKMNMYDTFANQLVDEPDVPDQKDATAPAPAASGGDSKPVYDETSAMEKYANQMNMIPPIPSMGGLDKDIQSIKDSVSNVTNMMSGTLGEMSSPVEPFSASFGSPLPSA